MRLILTETPRHALAFGVFVAFVLGALAACGSSSGDGASVDSASGTTPAYSYRVVRTYPHDPQAFTQGLVLDEGLLYEGTGLLGRSWVEARELETGAVLRHRDLPGYFGEGIAIFGDRLIQLTWTSRVGFVYDKRTFELLGQFRSPTEGWGLTHDGERLILSDGSSVLRFLDPSDFRVIGQVVVRDRGEPVLFLNELEHVRGEVYANVWKTDRIARIDPISGRVLGWIDLAGLLPSASREDPENVLNGIAHDPTANRLLVTGKRWPALFEIEVVPAP